MSEKPPKYRSQILEAIEGLRLGKTRPDTKRIASYCRRKFGISAFEVNADLERLVEHDILLKLDYKGSISYRDSSKWVHSSTNQAHVPLAIQHGLLLNSTMTSELIIDAVTSLSNSTAKSFPTSSRRSAQAHGSEVSFESIECRLISANPITSLRGEKLKKSLTREVDCCRIVELMNGCFVLPDRVEKSMKIRRVGTRQESKKSADSAPVVKIRPQRLKRAKPVQEEATWYDVEEEAHEEPKPKRQRKMSKVPKGTAKLDMALRKRSTRFCLECFDVKGMAAARAGDLLECVGCTYATHPECGGFSKETVEYQKGQYRCMQCKHCKICNTGKVGEDKKLIVCVRCDDAFHLLCHNPPVSLAAAVKVDWKCEDCKVALRDIKRKRTGNFKSKRPEYPPVASKSGVDRVEIALETKEPITITLNGFSGSSNSGNTYDGVNKSELVKNALDAFRQNRPPKKNPEFEMEVVAWTVDEVAQKFEERGAHAAAELMRNCMIDGYALTLLTREDIISRFGLRFVEALRLYREICQLCPFGPFSE